MDKAFGKTLQGGTGVYMDKTACQVKTLRQRTTKRHITVLLHRDQRPF